MKKRNTYPALFVAAALLTTIYLGGCDKSFTSEPIEQIKYVNPFSKIGDTHNEILEYVFRELIVEAESANASKTQNEREALVEKSVRKFFAIRGISVDDSLFIVLDDMRFGRPLEKTVRIDGASNQKKYFDKILLLVQKNKNYEDLRRSIERVEMEAVAELGEEAAPILCCTSVAVASKSYWDNNLTKWITELHENKKINKAQNSLDLPKTWQEYICGIVGADVEGAAAYIAWMGIVGSIFSWSSIEAAAGAASVFYVLKLYWELLSSWWDA